MRTARFSSSGGWVCPTVPDADSTPPHPLMQTPVHQMQTPPDAVPPTSPPVNIRAGLKTLPCHKLRLRAVKIDWQRVPPPSSPDKILRLLDYVKCPG